MSTPSTIESHGPACSPASTDEHARTTIKPTKVRRSIVNIHRPRAPAITVRSIRPVVLGHLPIPSEIDHGANILSHAKAANRKFLESRLDGRRS
jgi:hypothetical protein